MTISVSISNFTVQLILRLKQIVLCCLLVLGITFTTDNGGVTASAQKSVSPAFVEVAESASIKYRWRIEGAPPWTIFQTIGNGCAFLDYDGDGKLDILLVGSRTALYRGDGRGHFKDVSQATDIDQIRGQFLGCAVGDYDNDGYPDIYLTTLRGGALLHNERASTSAPTSSGSSVNRSTLSPPAGSPRRFRDVTVEAGLKPQPWGSSATFADLDGDGLLDLYIANYVRFDPINGRKLCNENGIRTACPPGEYEAEKGTLYRNLGGGRFRDVTREWGLDKVMGKALGVAVAPSDWISPSTYPNPKLMTLAIANDSLPSDLMTFSRQTSRNIGIVSGMGLLHGIPYGGMGVDWGDFDNDGWLDLIYSNGHVRDNIAAVDRAHGAKGGAIFRQEIALFHNLKGKRFEETTAQIGKEARLPIMGRGLAIGDYDNDGRLDALVVDSDGKPLLLHNVCPHAGHWLLVNLVGTRSNRDGYGAVITVEAGGRRLVRFSHADGSYMSSSDKRVHFGLGTASTIKRLQIQWPSGQIDTYTNVPIDRVLTLREGKLVK